ncbi:hypothetical protein [Cytobacillus firmus]
MSKKKAIKLAAASAVAASAFVAAAPAQTDAASNVAVEVSKAVTQMKKAYHTYSDVTAQGKFAPIADVYKEYNAAKKAYASAKALVNKAGGADKDKHLAELEDTYADFIAKRVITYIDAYNYATTLQDKQFALEDALKKGDWDAAEEQYHAISYELNTRTVILDRVYGKTTRELLRGSFKADAQAARDGIINEVSVKMYYDQIDALLEEGKLEEAEAKMKKIAEFVEKLDADTDFGAALLERVEAAEKKFEELSVPKVESVSAINAKSLSVKLNKELSTLDGLTFSVKRGTTTVVLNPKLSEDKKSVELASSTNLVAGEYEVTVTGGKFEDGSNSAKVTVAAQKVGKIEFNGDVLAKTGTGVGTIGFKVYDQYGTDITGSAASLVNAINWSANVAVDSLSDANGVLTVDLQGGTDFANGQKVLLTAVDPATAVSSNVEVTIGAASAVKTFTLGDVKLPKDVTRIYTGETTAATIDFAAEDQYGNKLDTVAKLNGITLLSSDANVVPTFTTVDGKAVLNINTSSLVTAKNVTITAVINATGQTVTKTLDIVQPAKPDTVTLGQLETNVVANGDAAGKFVLPITVVDQFGATLTAKQIADAYSAGTLTVTGTGSLASASLQVDTDSTSKNYGKVVNTAAVSDPAGVGTVVVTTAAGKTASTNFTTVAARKVVEIVAPKSVTTNLVSGASSTYAYQYKDQYGDLVTPAAANRNADLTWKFVVTDLTGDADVISVNKTTGSDEDGIGNVTVSSAAGKSGSAKVAAQLLNTSGEVVSQIETTFKVSANNAEGLVYSIGDVPTLFSHASNDAAVNGSDAYAAALKFTAKDANGNEYAIPASQILSVESVKGFFGVGTVGNGTIDAQDNSTVIGAKDAAEIGAAAFGTGNTVTDTIKVTLNTADGVKVLTKDVTISKEAPKTVELKVVDTAISAANPYELATGTKDVTSLTFASLADAIGAADGGIGDVDQNKVFVVKKDQYGVIQSVAKDFIVNSVGLISLPDAGDKFATTALGAFALVDGDTDVTYAAGKDITLSVVDGNFTDTLTVKINNIAALTASVSGKTLTAAGGAGATQTVTFERGLNAATKTAVVDALKAKATATNAAAVDNLTFNWNSAGTVLTVANTTAGTAVNDTVTFSADATLDLTDVFGNKTAGVAFDIN